MHRPCEGGQPSQEEEARKRWNHVPLCEVSKAEISVFSDPSPNKQKKGAKNGKRKI